MDRETKFSFGVRDLQVIQCALKLYTEELTKANNFPVADGYYYMTEPPYKYSLERTELLLAKIEKELIHATNS
jgi:hypothetical protein